MFLQGQRIRVLNRILNDTKQTVGFLLSNDLGQVGAVAPKEALAYATSIKLHNAVVAFRDVESEVTSKNAIHEYDVNGNLLGIIPSPRVESAVSRDPERYLILVPRTNYPDFYTIALEEVVSRGYLRSHGFRVLNG